MSGRHRAWPRVEDVRVLIVINPTARGGAFAGVGDLLLHRLTAAGWDAELRVPDSAADARALIASARTDRDAVVVAGGDGTVGIAVQELAGSNVRLGVIPTGTGNDFAISFGLHALDAASAVDTILAGRERVIDLGLVTLPDGSTRPFGTVLASGFDSLVNDRANRLPFGRGRVKYDIAILIEFLRLQRLGYTLTWTNADGTDESVAGMYLMASVANTSSYGGGVPIAPGADPADGVLDLILVRPARRLRLLALLAKVFRAAHENEPEVTMRRVRRVSIAADGVRAYADGDPVARLPVDVSVLPGALRLFVP